jgi:hypothetical protein
MEKGLKRTLKGKSNSLASRKSHFSFSDISARSEPQQTLNPHAQGNSSRALKAQNNPSS